MKLSLTHVRTNSQGYDSKGNFHHCAESGVKVYAVEGPSEETYIDDVVYAKDRNAAKTLVCKLYPLASFYN
jgi:hypothetical protein